MNWPRLKADVKRHEGYRDKPYQDTVGKLTIGWGRNLDDVGINEGEAELMLKHDLERALTAVRFVIFDYDELDEVRQEVLVNMAFNLGRNGLAGFRKMRLALTSRDYEEAAVQMLDSKWADQVGDRSAELAERMRTGEVS
jgi:lysozyme